MGHIFEVHRELVNLLFVLLDRRPLQVSDDFLHFSDHALVGLDPAIVFRGFEVDLVHIFLEFYDVLHEFLRLLLLLVKILQVLKLFDSSIINRNSNSA